LVLARVLLSPSTVMRVSYLVLLLAVMCATVIALDGPKPVAAKGVSSAPRVAAAARRTVNSAAAVARPAAKRLVVKAKAAVLTKAKAKVVKAMGKVVSATQALKMAEAAPSSGDQEQDTADLVIWRHVRLRPRRLQPLPSSIFPSPKQIWLPVVASFFLQTRELSQ